MEIRNIFGTKFRGSLDKTFTAVERKSGKNYMRRYVKPDDPQTEVQVRHRALFSKGGTGPVLTAPEGGGKCPDI